MLTLTQNEVFAGRYRVLKSLASGGMGAVYEVEHVETARHQALKVLLPSLVDRQEIRDRFKQEARITATIESEAIVQVFDAGVDQDTGMPFLVMELLKGEDLSRVLAREGAMPPSVVVGYLAQVANALDKTHDAKVVHRDLKPENLFLSRREDGSKQIKILDFGVAKLVVEGAAGASSTTGFGTPLYMAPEQFKCAGVCSSTDIYSLGMIAYTLLVGTPYWEPEVAKRGTVFAFATLAVNGTREPATLRARALGKELPAEFDAWFARMTAVEPKDRYQRPTQAIEDLARIFSVLLPARPVTGTSTEEPVSTLVGAAASSDYATTRPDRPSPPAPSKSRKAIIAAVALAGVIAAVAIALLSARQTAAVPSAQVETSPSASTQSATSAPVAEGSSAPAASVPEPVASSAPSSAPMPPMSGTLPGGGGPLRPAKAKPVATSAATASAVLPPPPDPNKSRYSRE